jgi:GNAT superfamily N-acetyltransferase
MSLASGYVLVDGAPSPLEYVHLRRATGLSPKTVVQAESALSGSWAFRRVETESGELVAMGRVIGDGGWYFLIADMATLPEHQGRGIGGAVLDSLLEEICARAEPNAYVTLTADPPGRRLYESRGFSDVAPDRTGMFRLT